MVKGVSGVLLALCTPFSFAVLGKTYSTKTFWMMGARYKNSALTE